MSGFADIVLHAVSIMSSRSPTLLPKAIYALRHEDDLSTGREWELSLRVDGTPFAVRRLARGSCRARVICLDDCLCTGGCLSFLRIGCLDSGFKHVEKVLRQMDDTVCRGRRSRITQWCVKVSIQAPCLLPLSEQKTRSLTEKAVSSLIKTVHRASCAV